MRETEIALARQLVAGEAGAFERFVDHFRAKIFYYSWWMCGHREDAEDVAQETLLKVFENFGQLREPERIRPWVFRIAKNACLLRRRKSAFAPASELSLDELKPVREQPDGGLRAQIADRSPLPDDQALRSEMRHELEGAIGKLGEVYRSVILLRDMEGHSTEETAQILDLTEDVVRTRLHRARLAVRKKLDERLLKGRGPAANAKLK